DAGDEIVAGGEVQVPFFVLEQGSDPLDKKRFADIQQLAARGEVKIEVRCGQGLHLARVLLDIGDQGIGGCKDIRVLKANAGSGLLSHTVGFLWDDGGGVKGEAANTRKVHLPGLI